MDKSTVLEHLGVTKEEVLYDYRVAVESREASLLGRREVLSGKAKFGIFGDGKEVPQLAMARNFAKGDFRSGYYRDQTFMFALQISSIREFFAQLYAIPDENLEPASAGRSMNGHFATRTVNPDGSWKKLTEMYNSSADISPTGSQMPRLVGLAQASKVYREVKELQTLTDFSNNGNEVAWGTIGNASCAEGMFWESVNAIGVLKVPAIISIWDDGYGISVPNKFQVTKDNIGELLSGFQRKPDSEDGYDVYTARAWNYPELIEKYRLAAKTAREKHIPAIVHVIEVTQPQGHSTSGSHERYKSKERLQWETDYCCNRKMREWILSESIASEEELTEIELKAKQYVLSEKNEAWKAYSSPIKSEVQQVTDIFQKITQVSKNSEKIAKISQELLSIREPFRRDIFEAIHAVLLATRGENIQSRTELLQWKDTQNQLQVARYGSHLFTESNQSIHNPKIEPARFSENSPMVNGSEVINAFFTSAFARDPRTVIFGEDVGQLGDVNQGCIGLQEKYGVSRVFDTGIREVTILGQEIGMAMRGLRPIAEIQYLDYLLYALQLMSDDLATVQWRTKGGQKSPVIIRTRGHRLEGVWHSGSPMAGIINLVRGIHVCVPRNLTQAAGMYNLLLQAEEPALVVEVLNGYRLKEKLPSNIAEFTVPLGVPEIIAAGTDITLVTYGSTVRVAQKAVEMLASVGVSVELVDVQTLLPFDTNGIIVESLKKTNRVIFVDEDVPGGTTAFMMQQVLEVQNGYRWLDSAPKTLSARNHRPAYGTDGNYWSKPEAEHIFDAVYAIMHESSPTLFPVI